jgi:putative transcriptional regulator
MKKTIREKIGLYLKKARAKKKLSQSQLASMLGYSNAQYISDWERGYSAIPMNQLQKICSYLEADPQELFELMLELAKERLEEDMREKI